MNKALLLVTSTALLWSCSTPPEETTTTPEETVVMKINNWKTGHLMGAVKTIEESPYTPDEMGVIGAMDSCCIEVTTFNDMGYITTYAEQDSEGNVTLLSEREYFEDGAFKSAVRTRNGKPDGGRTVTRDAEGHVLHAIDTDSTGNAVYFYDGMKRNADDQPLEGTRYTADSVFTGTWTRKYTDGMTTGWGWSDSTGTMVSERTAELNDKGWIAKYTEVEAAGPDSLTTTVHTYTYDALDEMGNWTKRTKYDADGKVTMVVQRTYTYFDTK